MMEEEIFTKRYYNLDSDTTFFAINIRDRKDVKFFINGILGDYNNPQDRVRIDKILNKTRLVSEICDYLKMSRIEMLIHPSSFIRNIGKNNE